MIFIGDLFSQRDKSGGCMQLQLAATLSSIWTSLAFLLGAPQGIQCMVVHHKVRVIAKLCAVLSALKGLLSHVAGIVDMS